MLPRLFPIYDTHNTYAEGGRKIHVFDEKAGKCLCGYLPGLFNEVDFAPHYTGLAGYLSQPDPDRNVCIRCRKAALKMIQS